MNIFITGISRGLGKAIAEEYASTGHSVWGISRTRPDGLPSGVRHSLCDLADPASIERAWREMEDAEFEPDIVILNAAVIGEDVDGGVDLQAVKRSFEVNCLGNLAWVHLLLPRFLERNAGVFLHVSSASVFRAAVRRKIAYPATKSAMDLLFEGLRINFGRGRVRFFSVRLGPLAETLAVPLLSRSCRDAAQRIVRIAGGDSSRNCYSYPLLAGMLFRSFNLLPDRMIRWMLQRSVSLQERTGA